MVEQIAPKYRIYLQGQRSVKTSPKSAYVIVPICNEVN